MCFATKAARLALVSGLSLPLAAFALTPTASPSGSNDGTVLPALINGDSAAPLLPRVFAGILYFVDSTGDGDHVGSVNSCQDITGKCTLRAAIQAANAHLGEDGIDISIPASDPFCSGGSCTINLTKTLPDLSTTMGITGPGADKLTVRRATGGDFHVFTVTTAGTVTLSGMTISNGFTTGGGGGLLNSSSATVNITSCALTSNTGIVGGGGILNNAGASAGGTVNLVRSTLTGNRAGGTFDGSTSFASGGGIANHGTLNVTNSTISSNVASGGLSGGVDNVGGGILNNKLAGTVNVKSSIIALNTATGSARTLMEASFPPAPT